MKRTFWPAFASILIIGCSPPASKISRQNTKPQETVLQKTTIKDATGLALNKGQKWQVNPEMKPFILDAENLLEKHIRDSSKDYKTLAIQLEEKDAAFIQRCTMKGESHEELHKWLHPHLELVAALKKANNAEQADRIIQTLQQSFITFHQYFD